MGFSSFSFIPGDGVLYNGKSAVFVRFTAKGRAAIINTAPPGKNPRYAAVLTSELQISQK